MIAVTAFMLLAILSLPLIGAFFVMGIVGRLFSYLRGHPILQRVIDLRRASALRRQIVSLQASQSFPSAERFAGALSVILNGLPQPPTSLLTRHFEACSRALYVSEGLGAEPPRLPKRAAELDRARHIDRLSQLSLKLSNPQVPELARDALLRSYAAICRALPPLAEQDRDSHLMEDNADTSLSSVKLLDILPNVPEVVEALIEPFYAPSLAASGLFSDIRKQLDMNRHRMSGVLYSPQNLGSRKLIEPSAHGGTDDEIVQGYLKQTPLKELFAPGIPFEIPSSLRFEHQWIVAGSGHGKTQSLQYFIARDLARVATGSASVIVIDSQGDLIKTIAGLKQFAPGGALQNKLCLIDPTDIEYPVALNLFDAGLERIDQYSALDRERLMNGVLELYDFVLGSLLSAELTQKQGVIFRYITRLMLHIPGATIHTFRELMEPGGYQKYLPHIAKLEGTTRAFFETEFNSKQFEDTKRQVVRRLWGILENRTFERMFSHPKNKLDLFSEMNAGKVILINTAKELLKQNGTEIFGRFFIALIAQAAQERATLPRDRRKPTFVYVDECADYLDQNISLILEQARKQNVGMILAHQYIGQLSPKLQESFAANTSIKFAGGVSDRDARALAHMLRCSPEFIDGQPKGHFAAFVRNLTASAVSLRIPFGHLEAMPRMTQEEYEGVRSAMRERYGVYWKSMSEVNAPEVVQHPAEPAADVASAAEW